MHSSHLAQYTAPDKILFYANYIIYKAKYSNLAIIAIHKAV